MPDSAPLPGVEEHVDWDTRVAGALAFLRRRITGDYEVDDFGFDPELTDRILLAPLRPLYKRWFRIETRGREHPGHRWGAAGGQPLGTVAVDSMMTQLAIWDNHPEHRRLRMLGADFVFQLPIVSELARKGGHTLACADAERLLVGQASCGQVWPEGFKGISKPFSEAVQAAALRPGGFVAAALVDENPDHPLFHRGR